MNVETMRLLVAKGLSAEDILEIAETMDSAPAPRSSGAERQARYRARKAQEAAESNVTCDVTRDGDSDVTEVTEASLPRLPNENNSNPSTPTHEKQTPRTRKAHRLPADWVPAPLTDELDAALASWPVDAVDRELAKFRDWAKAAPASSGSKSDWDATWRNWLRRAEDEGRYRNGSNRNNSGSAPPRHAGRPRDGAIAELDRQLGLDGFGEPLGRWDAGGGPGSGGRALARARPV